MCSLEKSLDETILDIENGINSDEFCDIINDVGAIIGSIGYEIKINDSSLPIDNKIISFIVITLTSHSSNDRFKNVFIH